MAERAREAVPGANVIVGDAGALPFEDGSFDVVLSAFTVFFFDEPTDALREWGRVLEPAGRIAMSTWGAADPRWAWERELRMRFIGDIPPERLGAIGAGFQRLTRFDEAGKVEHELRAAGFVIVALTPDQKAMGIGEFVGMAAARGRVAVLLGTEGDGLTDAALAAADVRVRIPMRATSARVAGALDSLNIATAAGIALHRLHEVRDRSFREGK
jgi:SAM-dependent methyltransferase